MNDDVHHLSLPPVTTYSTVPILIVDDNAAKRLALRSVLSPVGYRIVDADSGIAGLRCLIAEDFAVILMDVRMPVMNGFETSQLVRQRARSELTPIIFITAYGKGEMDDLAAYATGAADFMFSPVPPAELRAKVSVFANLYLRAEFLAAQARGVQEATDQLRLLTDAAPIGIFRADAQKNYTYVNARWTDITGICSEDAVGRHWDLVSPGQHGRDPTVASKRASPDPPFDHPFEIRHRTDLTARIVQRTANSISADDGVVVGWVGILADVTVDVAAKAAMLVAHDAALLASETDPLTLLSNRRRLERDLVIECELSVRHDRPLSFIMLDADSFKTFNDANGHQAGDTVLQELGKIFIDTLRGSDTAYRYGGEEFCLLLRETAAAEAMLVAERIRVRIERDLTDRGLPVTASFGVAAFPEHGRTPEHLVAAADGALYAAKRAGRNRVVLGDIQPPDGPGTPSSTGDLIAGRAVSDVI